MGAQILSFPFRVTPAGYIATVDQSSQGAAAEQIGVLIATRQGERELVPGFGVPDPAFVGISPGSIINGVRLYGPPVRITNINVRAVGSDTQAVRVSFT